MGFDQSDYVDVKTKLRLAYARWPDMKIHETEPKIVEIGGDLKIQITCTVHRTPDDPIPAVFTCWEPYPGTTPFTRGSEQQNCSTSAVGRALSIAGIGLGSPIASAEDVRNAQAANTGPSDTAREPQEPRDERIRTTAPSGDRRRQAPTDKMIAYARSLADRKQIALSKADLDSFDACKAFIEAHKD